MRNIFVFHAPHAGVFIRCAGEKIVRATPVAVAKTPNQSLGRGLVYVRGRCVRALRCAQSGSAQLCPDTVVANARTAQG